MKAQKKKKKKHSKSETTKKETKNIAETITNSILENVIKNPDLSEEDKAKAAYSTVTYSLQQFMALSSLQARILNETRALEGALAKSGLKSEDFDIMVSAKAKSAAAEKITQEVRDGKQPDSGKVEAEEQQESAPKS
jgi:predicted nucleic acid-binding protein